MQLKDEDFEVVKRKLYKLEEESLLLFKEYKKQLLWISKPCVCSEGDLYLYQNIQFAMRYYLQENLVLFKSYKLRLEPSIPTATTTTTTTATTTTPQAVASPSSQIPPASVPTQTPGTTPTLMKNAT